MKGANMIGKATFDFKDDAPRERIITMLKEIDQLVYTKYQDIIKQK
jgi:hypothetical protein